VVRVLDRRGLLESVERLGKIAPEAPLSFLIVIVDGLDAIGEVEADLTMRLVAGRLRSLTRATDAVGKLSGSAFGVLLQGTGSTAAGAVAARLSYHVGNVLRGIHAELGVRVTAATGTGVNWPTLPVAAAESLPDAG
jgi:GGDEF domain-containing protein